MKKTYITNREFKEQYPEIQFITNYYYSISIIRTDNDCEKYNSYIGIKVLQDLIEYNIVNNENYNNNWKNRFCDKLEKQLKQKVIGATYGYVPNYSAFITLEESEDLRYRTEIHFTISLLAELYSIEIIEFDKFKAFKDSLLGEYITQGILNVTVSPEGKYKDIFLEVENFIKDLYKDFIFLPYIFETIHLKGLQVTYKDEEDCLISNAFFNKFEKQDDTIIYGDIYYRIEDIKKIVFSRRDII